VENQEHVCFFNRKSQRSSCDRLFKNPLSKSEVVGLLEKLQLTPLALIRTNEKIWLAEFKGKKLTNDQLIEAMVANPILIERPIVVKGNQAVIARPLENVNKII